MNYIKTLLIFGMIAESQMYAKTENETAVVKRNIELKQFIIDQAESATDHTPESITQAVFNRFGKKFSHNQSSALIDMIHNFKKNPELLECTKLSIAWLVANNYQEKDGFEIKYPQCEKFTSKKN